MFNFRKRSVGSPSFRTILRLDSLDGRYSPSVLLGNEFVPNVPLDSTAGVMTLDDDGSGNAFGASLVGNNPNLPPVISITEVAWTAPSTYRISGTVTDENPAGLTVTFGSAIPALNGLTTVTDANGNYTVTVFVGAARGDFWVQTTDAQGLASNIAEDFIP